MLSKKNNILLHKFLTTIHMVVSGRPSASPSGPILYLLDKHRWKRKNSLYWTNLFTGWGNEIFKSVQIVRSTSRKIREILQTFITNNPPDAHYNLSASSVNSSQIPFIKILPWLTLRKPKKNKWGEAFESNSNVGFSVLFKGLSICGAVLPVPSTSAPDHVWTGRNLTRETVYPNLSFFKWKKHSTWMHISCTCCLLSGSVVKP